MTSRPEIEDLPAGATRSRGTGEPGGPTAASPAGSTGPAATARIVCEGLVRIYKVADLEVVALQGLDLLVEPGEMIAIVGASGSGKSTLLNILGGLDAPTAGRAVVAGHDLGRMTERDRTRYRRRVVGFVWQQTARNLLPYLTAIENVELPMLLEGTGARERRRRATELLSLVGLTDRAEARPEQLSGGEQQRVAVAVALANRPPVLLADEPTGELDTATAGELFAALHRLNAEYGTTIVLVTHDPLVSEQVGRTVAIRDGRTSSETIRRRSEHEDGEHRVVAEEFAVLDRAGRLQLPRAHVDALGLRDRVRLRLEPDHIGVWAGGAPNGAAPGPSAAAPGPEAPASPEPPSPDAAAPNDPHARYRPRPRPDA